MASGTQWGMKRTVNAQEPRVSHEDIARVAYELFERRGRVHGFDQQDWCEAERILRQRRSGGNGR